MSDDNNDPLSAAFGLPAPVSETKPQVIDIDDIHVDAATKATVDHEFARQNLKELIKTGTELFNDAATIAKQNQQSNSFTSAAQILKAVVDANKELMDSNKKHVDIVGTVGRETGPKSVTNNLVVTADLLKQIKEMKRG